MDEMFSHVLFDDPEQLHFKTDLAKVRHLLDDTTQTTG